MRPESIYSERLDSERPTPLGMWISSYVECHLSRLIAVAVEMSADGPVKLSCSTKGSKMVLVP